MRSNTLAFLVGFLICSSLAFAVPRVTLPGGSSGKVAEAYMADASIVSQTAFSADASAVAIALAADPSDCAADRYATSIASSGNLTCSQVSLTAGVSGTLPIASGGTNGTATPTAGAVPYGTGTAYAFSLAGSAGDCLKSGGAGSPTWGSCSSISAYGTIQDEGTPLTQQTTLNFAGSGVTCADDTTRTTCTIPSGAPVDATYIVQTANGTLTNEQALGALGTALLQNTTTTGVLSAYAGATCTNQFVRALSATGAATCNSVSLTADVTGTLAASNGGTGITTATEDATLVGNGTNYVSSTLPSCSTASSALTYNTTTNAFGCNTIGGVTVQTARTTGTHTIGSTTATEVTALQVSLAGAGTYDARYTLRVRSSNVGNGYKFGVNVTANLSSLNCVATHATTGTTAATGVGDGVAAVLTGSLYEVLGATSTASTTAANMGPNTGVSVTTDSVQVIITCSIVTSGAGDLELWMGSEAAVNVTTEANSYVVVTTIP